MAYTRTNTLAPQPSREARRRIAARRARRSDSKRLDALTGRFDGAPARDLTTQCGDYWADSFMDRGIREREFAAGRAS